MKEIIPNNAQPENAQIQFGGSVQTMAIQSISKKFNCHKQKITNVQKGQCAFFTNKFQKYLKTKKNNENFKKILLQLKAAKNAKKKPEVQEQFDAIHQQFVPLTNVLNERQEQQKAPKYQKIQLEFKELKTLLKDQEFMEVWLKFLKSEELKKYIEEDKKIKPDNRKEYINLIPNFLGESQSEKPFENVLGITYVVENDQFSQNQLKDKSQQQNSEKCFKNLEFPMFQISYLQFAGQMSIKKNNQRFLV